MTEQAYIDQAESLKARLYRTAVLYLGSESAAVDAVDEAIYKGFRGHTKLRQPAYFGTWLTRILINVCHNELRRRKRELAVETLPETAQEQFDALPLKEAIRRLPEELRAVITLRYRPDWETPMPPGVGDLTYEGGEAFDQFLAQQKTVAFMFPIRLDPTRMAESRTIPVGQWVELDGHRVLIDRLEVSLTRSALYLDTDERNTRWLTRLGFWFEDSAGNRFDRTDGILSATGEPDSPEFLTYYRQSFYFDPPDTLTLCIGEATWRAKENSWVSVDLTSLRVGSLPEGVSIADAARSGDDVKLWVAAPSSTDPFTHHYRDPEGGAHYFNRMELSSQGPDISHCFHFTLEEYPWDTVELQLSYTSVSTYEDPVAVPIE